MNISAKDVDVLARTIYGEARGEDRVGQICVGWVVRNRAELGYRGNSLSECALKRWQFSCWNADDPNYQKLNQVDLSDEVYRECMRNALQVIAGGIDPTNGATHYHTISKPKAAVSWPPNWAEGHQPCATIGRHVFYKGVP